MSFHTAIPPPPRGEGGSDHPGQGKRSGHTADLMLARGIRGVLNHWGPAGAALAAIVSGATAVSILETKLDALEKKVDRIQSAEVLVQRVDTLERQVDAMNREIPVAIGKLEKELAQTVKRLDFQWKRRTYRQNKNPAAGVLEDDDE